MRDMLKNPDFEEDCEWFRENLAELKERYPEEYVAVLHQEVVAHGPRLEDIVPDVYLRFDERPIMIQKVEEPHVITMPSVFLE